MKKRHDPTEPAAAVPDIVLPRKRHFGAAQTALIFFAIIGLYTQLTLYRPVYIPFVLFGGAGIALLILQPVSRVLWARVALVIGLPALGLMLTLLLRGAAGTEGQLRSLLLLVLSVLSSMGWGLALLQVGRRRVAFWLGVLTLLLAIGATLEVAGLLRGVSDLLRVRLYPADQIYSADLRDIAAYGLVRPKLFTAEPSYLGKALAMFGAAAALLQTDLRRKLMILLVLSLCALVVRSPALLPGLLVVSLDLLRVILRPQDGTRANGPLRALTLVVLPLLLALPALWVLSQIGSRLGLSGAQIEASAYMRLIQPFHMVWGSLAERPIIGFGLGADSSLLPLFVQTLSHIRAPEYLLVYGFEHANSAVQYGNFYAGLILQMGVGLGAIWVWAIHRFISSLTQTGTWPVWIFLLSYGLFTGPINTPTLWGPMVLIAVCLQLREES